MKLAFVTEDGENISAHFGRAPYYLVIEIDGGHEIHREMREKMGHVHFQAADETENHTDTRHGFSAEAQSRHASMLNAVMDCDLIVCGGMGQGALQSLQASGKEVLLTDVQMINQALDSYLSGELPHRSDLSH